MDKAWMNWSSGKDSALALYYIQQEKSLEVQKLFTTLDASSGKVSMHDVTKELLYAQAESIGIDMEIANIATSTSLEDYNKGIGEKVEHFREEGMTHSIFGDIFLEDLKEYRESQLKKVNIEPVFPLWKTETSKLIREFIDLGFKAICVCTNSKYLDDSFCGRIIDEGFVADLPKNVDPCGENGEFHTFVFDGPIFKKPILFKKGKKIKKSFPSKDEKWDAEFCFLDLFPA